MLRIDYNSSISFITISTLPFVSSSAPLLIFPDENLTTSVSRVDKFTRTISLVSLNLGMLIILTFCPSSPGISQSNQHFYPEQVENHIQADFRQKRYAASLPTQTDLDPETDNTLKSD